MLIAKWTLNVGLVAQSLASSVVLANNYVFFSSVFRRRKEKKKIINIKIRIYVNN